MHPTLNISPPDVQGNNSRCPRLYNLKVMPVALGYIAQVATNNGFGGEATVTQHHIAVSSQLLNDGLAMPVRLHSLKLLAR